MSVSLRSASVFSGYELHYYLAIRAARLGFHVCETPVTRAYPPGKTPTKIRGIRGNLLILRTLWRACRHHYDPPRNASALQSAARGIASDPSRKEPSMKAALIGHTGFVGGNLLREYPFAGRYHSANIETIAGRAFRPDCLRGRAGRQVEGQPGSCRRSRLLSAA